MCDRGVAQMKDEEICESNTCLFQPPLYIQRKLFICHKLKEFFRASTGHALLDIGCGGGQVMTFMKEEPIFARIDGIDRDLSEINNARILIQPSMQHYLQPRSDELTMSLIHDDFVELMMKYDESEDAVASQFAVQYDAVVCTEVIEHVHEGEEVQHLTQFIFKELQPDIAIITTPNYEFNKWFTKGEHITDCKYTLRHDDHKFEWTREEFENWIKSVQTLTNFAYSFEIFGIGDGPDNSTGCATQAAVFIRSVARTRSIPFTHTVNTICTIDYPTENDTRTLDEQLLDECLFACRTLLSISKLSDPNDLPTIDQIEEFIHASEIYEYLTSRSGHPSIVNLLNKIGKENFAPYLRSVCGLKLAWLDDGPYFTANQQESESEDDYDDLPQLQTDTAFYAVYENDVINDESEESSWTSSDPSMNFFTS